MSEKYSKRKKQRQAERQLCSLLFEETAQNIADATIHDSCNNEGPENDNGSLQEEPGVSNYGVSNYSPQSSLSDIADISPLLNDDLLCVESRAGFSGSNNNDVLLPSKSSDTLPTTSESVNENSGLQMHSEPSSVPSLPSVLTLASSDSLSSDSSLSDCERNFKECSDISFPIMSDSFTLHGTTSNVSVSTSDCDTNSEEGGSSRNDFAQQNTYTVDEFLGISRDNSDQALKTKLQKWAVKYNVRRNAVDELLDILREHGHNELPKSAKTILQTPKNTTLWIKDLAGGSYWYRGLLHCLQLRLSEAYIKLYSKNAVITIDVFVDGVSPHRSIKRHLWPIAGCLIHDTKPFTIAMWCGENKQPSDVDKFLTDFIEEAGSLMNDGFTFKEQKYHLQIRHILADAPARAWLRKVNQHGSYSACERCTIKGEWIGSRMTYDPEEEATLRTDDNFLQQSHKDYHKGVSKLLELNIKMITQFPLDIMHLLYLGCVKRFLGMLLKKKASKYKLKDVEKETLSQLCIFLQKFFPSEFERKPKHLSDWATYKAVDFRRILYYEGLVVFRNVENQELFKCFLLLSCGMRILIDDDLRPNYSSDAHAFLQGFVNYACNLFGRTFVVYNVHHLSHIVADCALHGNPESFSCFKFENSLGEIKHLLHAPGRVLVQIINRVSEKEKTMNQSFSLSETVHVAQPHRKGPTLGLQGDQYAKLVTKGFKFRLNLADSSCLMKDSSIVVIENFVKNEDDIFVIGRAFKSRKNLFVYPVNSSYFNIFKVSTLGELQKWNINCIYRKVVLLPLGVSDVQEIDWNVLCGVSIPMLHNEG